jgi:outer membrane protein OmpA-like peptidoglycan-associated protein
MKSTIKYIGIFLFGAIASFLGLVVWGDTDGTELTLLGTTNAIDDTTGTTPKPLLPVDDDELSQNTPITAYAQYSRNSIALTGSVNAQALADALIVASNQLTPGGTVTAEFEILSGVDLAIINLEISGEIIDESDRSRVVTRFEALGVKVIDKLVIEGSERTVFEVIRDLPELSQVFDFFSAAGVEEQISEEIASVTVFAPTNEAMQALDITALQEFAQLVQLSDILQFHIVPGDFYLSQLSNGADLETLKGESLTVQEVDQSIIKIQDSSVIQADITAANGVIHIIDAVLIPGTIKTEIALNQIVGSDPILFAVGSPFLAESSKPILNEVAGILLENPEGNLEIEGHSDTDGAEDINLDLSASRAEAVLEYLISRGVEPSRLSAIGYGETRLKIDPEVTASDRAANRRIEFRVIFGN